MLYRFQRRSNADNKVIFTVLDLVNFFRKQVDRVTHFPKKPHDLREIFRIGIRR